MDTVRLALIWGVIAASLYQLWRVPRLWAFLFLFIVVFPKIALVAVPGETTPIRMDDVVLATVLGGWILYLFLARRPALPPAPATPFLLLYAVVAIATSLFGIGGGTATPTSAALHFMRRVEYALLYYFFFRSVAPDQLRDVIRLVRFSLLTILAIWLVQTAILELATNPGVGAYIDWTTATPSFSASYDFGGYLMLATVFLYAVWSTHANRSLLTAIALAGGVGLLLFAADSRAALAGMAIAISLDLFFRLRWQVVVAGIVAAASAPYLVSSKKMENMLNILSALFISGNLDSARDAFYADPSIGMRLRNWEAAAERWSEHPLTGEGLGSYLQYTEQYNQPGTPDGWYIRLLAESGLLGLLAFMLLVGGLLWTLFRAYVHETEPLPRAIVYGAALSVIAMLVNALLIDSFVSYKIMGVFWMIVGVGTRVAAEQPPVALKNSDIPAVGIDGTAVPGFKPA